MPQNKTVFHTILTTLSAQHVEYTLLEHEPIYTMEQAKEICGSLPEQDVKVLFAKAYKTKSAFSYFLVVWTGDKEVDFRSVANHLGVKKIKLASVEEVNSELGIETGALSPFGYETGYPVIFDKALLAQQELFINPGVHDKTIKLKSHDLQLVIKQSAPVLYTV